MKQSMTLPKGTEMEDGHKRGSLAETMDFPTERRDFSNREREGCVCRNTCSCRLLGRDSEPADNTRGVTVGLDKLAQEPLGFGFVFNEVRYRTKAGESISF